METRKSRIWPVAAGLALVVTAVVGGREYARVRAESRRDRQAIDRLSSAVDQLEQQPANVVRVIERETRVERPEPERAAEEPQPAAASQGMTVEQAAHLRATRLETAYAAEPIDGAWSDRAGGELRAAITALGARENVESVECRKTLCRIESRFSSIAPYNRFVDELASKPQGGEGMLSPQIDHAPDGSLRAVSYWVREGNMKNVAALLDSAGS